MCKYTKGNFNIYRQLHFSSLLSQRTSVTVQHGRTKKGKVAPKVSGTTYFNQTSNVKEPLSGDFMVVCCMFFKKYHFQNVFNSANLPIKWNSQNCKITSHSAYVATETELVVAKIDGLLTPNFL